MRPILLFLSVFLFITMSSCKDEVKSSPPATIKVNDTITKSSPKYLYVTAVSGLTMRSLPNLESEKLTVMPLGSKVHLLSSDSKDNINVGGIDGTMVEIEFDSKKGYAFSGFLSEFLSAEGYSSAKIYAEDLKQEFPNIIYVDSITGQTSNPSKTESLILPTEDWHKAFFTAQQLFGIPKGFAFPAPKGANRETQNDRHKPSTATISELNIFRSANRLQKIEYIYKTKQQGYQVTISKEGKSLKMTKAELFD